MSAHTPQRVSTGVAGLDDILGGGVPANRLYLIQGEPGTGKTTLALQFLLDGVARGERCLYVTLSETEEELREIALSHGWSLDGITLHELSAVEQALQAESDNTVFNPSDVELNETMEQVLTKAQKVKPQRVVFDSLSEMRLLARDPLRYRRQVLALKQFFARRESTVLFLDDRTTEPTDLQLQSIAHGVTTLEAMATEHGSARRRLRVVKMRGVRFRDGFHDYRIERGGLLVYPRLLAPPSATALDESDVMASGNAELDEIWGGGVTRGTSTVVIGPAGVGKSTICTQYAHAAALRGERVAFLSFEETSGVMFARARGMGLALDSFVSDGLVTVRQIDPGEISPGELVHLVRDAVEKQKAKVLVIDSLNGYLNSMPEERFLVVQLHELLTYMSDRGVNGFLVVAQHGLVGTAMRSPIDVTYLADSVLLLRFFESEGEVRHALSVVKKRSGSHERTLREYQITEKGIVIGEPLTHFHGVLTGTPDYRGPNRELLENKR